MPTEVEKEILNICILQVEAKLFGVTPTKLQQFASSVAVRKKYSHTFNTIKNVLDETG